MHVECLYFSTHISVLEDAGSWICDKGDSSASMFTRAANLNFTIPPEIMEAQGWKEGDPLKISWGDQGSIIITKLDEMPQETD